MGQAQALQKSNYIHKLAAASPDTESFENTYKTAYSHGLEAIYSLENVDLSSVRRISGPEENKPKKELPKPLAKIALSSQLSLDLGGEYRDHLPSFRLQEPIQVLGLTRHIEKALNDNDIKILLQLKETKLDELVFLKGLGQGHIDEIKTRLNQYLKNTDHNNCQTLDCAAWVNVVVAAFDRKRVKVYLQDFELADLISLSPVESMEVRRLTLEKKQEWKQEVEQLFLSDHNKEFVGHSIRDITDVYLKPWMRQRYGFATGNELVERLQRISDNPEMARLALEFMSSVYYKHVFPLKKELYEIDDNLYCVDKATFDYYSQVIKKARSYFYKPHITYKLSELVTWLKREFAQGWQGYSEGFIEKALRFSPDFRVRKGDEGHLVIRLS